jgi:hypothetical protein
MPATVESRTLAGAMAWAGLGLLLTATRPVASRAADVRRAATAVRHRAAFIDRDRDTKLEHQERADHVTRLTSAD